MLNIAEFDDRTAGRSGMGHPHTSELIMHWVNACSDSADQRITGGSSISIHRRTHPNQLVAVWIEQGAPCCEHSLNRWQELRKRSMERNERHAPYQKSPSQY